MKKMKFATKQDAVQFLCDLLQDSIRIGAIDNEILEEGSDLMKVLQESKKTIEGFHKTLKDTKKLEDKFEELMEEYMSARNDLVKMLKDLDEEEVEKSRTSSRFASLDAAIQYLSDFTNCRIIIER